MSLRDFFIEDRLERFRTNAQCNLGESGIRNLYLSELASSLNMDLGELGALSLADSPNQGRADLREEIAALYPNTSPDQVLVTTGTGEALFLTFCLLLEKGDTVSLFWPAFQALYEIPLFRDARLNTVSLLDRLEEQELGFGERNIRSLFEEHPKLVIFNHPHNPTGISSTESDHRTLREINQESKDGTWILFDEHYRFLDGDSELGWTGIGISDRSIATGSITKCFGVMGLRIGWLVGPREFIEKARSMKDYLTHTVSPISEFLTLQILRRRNELQKRIRSGLNRNINFFSECLSDLPGLDAFRAPAGGIVGFPKLAKGLESKSYADMLVEKADIFVLPGLDFETEGYIRVGFGETPERFEEGMERWRSLGSETMALLNK
ncbi:aminotransferase, class I/II [Leptospira fainei serovar Hurstbridge str. BUT 6]|uniref:Aminotransferase n=1 Tax=Leptospira fainei serovar Hurstbridge str. BUT 6 TaxID=1193011 RepID=S3V1T4_9LEPT|nr:pyridoxal phosphate-dependent aminotransferase [Leptospira fainei]EPG75388.1 aminotransferase, class I/II [Leptospira fainei serovar Hurstbridge str. BUT 6]